jgi:ElaA protein
MGEGAMMGTENLLWREFEDLRPQELYALLRIRCEVFVVEQACVFAEIDGKDPSAFHLLGWVGAELGGCLRVFPPGVTGAAARISRVVVTASYRGTGLGRRQMVAALAEIERRYGAVPVELSAQAYLEGFYGALGFVRVSPDYLEDDILHCDMRRG